RSMKVVLRALGDATGGTRQLLLGKDRFTHDEVVGWDSPSTRFRTFDAIARALSELAKQRALVLVFDDLHNADLASLLLVRFVAEQVRDPLLLLGTLRDAGPLADAAKSAVLSSLRSSLGTEIRLAGLEATEVEALLAAKNDDDRAFARRLFSRSGGNPLFLSMLSSEPAQTELPSAVRQAVLARVGALGERVVGLLELASVFGADLEPP